MKSNYFRNIAGTAIMAFSLILGVSSITAAQSWDPYQNDRYRRQQDEQYRRQQAEQYRRDQEERFSLPQAPCPLPTDKQQFFDKCHIHPTQKSDIF